MDEEERGLGRRSELLQSVPEWSRHGWLRAGFSGRLGGISHDFAEVKHTFAEVKHDFAGVRETGLLNLGFIPQDWPEAVQENRRRLVDSLGPESWRLVVTKQVHGVVVREVTTGNAAAAMVGGRGEWEADGMVTGVAGVLLGVGAADCVPLLVADLRERVVGAFHAGWRGTAARMAGVALARMTEVFGTRAEDCVAAVGPSIGACCYEVGEEVREAIVDREQGGREEDARDGEAEGGGVLVATGADRWRLDLWEANRQQLVAAGVPAAAVTVVGECTACSRDAEGRRRYFSYRAEGGITGRMLGVIGVRPDRRA